jgi:hypothetical protein
MNRQSENLPPDYAHERRSRYNSTSNTWTSSSEEETETDDIGDRTFYIGTFNKLARDVCGKLWKYRYGVLVG